MNSDQTTVLWEELKLLQGIVDKFDKLSYRIKNWFLTIFVAIAGYSIAQGKPSLLALNFLVILTFYGYELTYRTSHNDFLRRFREVQSLLRGDVELDEFNRGPSVDKYLFDVGDGDLSGWFAQLMLKAGVKEERAKRNLKESQFLVRNLWLSLFQFRVSLVYVCAFLTNLVFIVYLAGQ